MEELHYEELGAPQAALVAETSNAMDDDDDEEGTLIAVAPEGYTFDIASPDINSNLIGRLVLYKWSTSPRWFVGKVTQVYDKPRGKNQANVEIHYDDGRYDQRLEITLYDWSGLDDVPPGSLCALEPKDE